MKKIMNWIKIITQISLIVFFLLIGIETSLYYFFNFKNIVKGDTKCKIYDDKKNYSYYKPNCKLYLKHWEQNYGVEYNFNDFGRRDDSNNNDYDKLIAFVGDSFTFGAMVPIEKNYNFKAINLLNYKNYSGHNYGVSGEEFHNIFSKLKDLNFDEYEAVVYGLTPNDLFDIVDAKQFNFKSSSETNKDKNKSFKFLKTFLLSTSTSRALLHYIMSQNKIYLNTYMAREPYSGYLKSPLPDDFNNALDLIFEKLDQLDNNLKSKLIIFLLPQRAEVVAYKLGKHNDDFNNKFINNCKKKDIKCGLSNISKLSELEKSHFSVDGHLTIKGNGIVANNLVKLLKKHINEN